MSTDLYEKDFYAWCFEQADLIKKGSFEKLDIENLVEEMESLGRQERQELYNRLTVLLLHILKIKSRTDMAKLSFPNWRNIIWYQQKDIRQHLKENPSLQSCLSETCLEAYETAKDRAAVEAGIVYEDLPVSMTFTLEEALYGDWESQN